MQPADALRSSAASPSPPVTPRRQPGPARRAGRRDRHPRRPLQRCAVPARPRASPHQEQAVVDMGEPRHRGVDLIATDTDDDADDRRHARRTRARDKALEDEDVELFACTGTGWQASAPRAPTTTAASRSRSPATARLPIGLRDLYVAVADGTGVWFLALVAPAGSRDDRVRCRRHADRRRRTRIPTSLAVGSHVGVQPGAPAVFIAAAAARASRRSSSRRAAICSPQATRDWLADKGFPRAPIQLRVVDRHAARRAHGRVQARRRCAARDAFDIVAAIGNRASDIDAYARRRLSARPHLHQAARVQRRGAGRARPAQGDRLRPTTPICRLLLDRLRTSTCRRRACA